MRLSSILLSLTLLLPATLPAADPAAPASGQTDARTPKMRFEMNLGCDALTKWRQVRMGGNNKTYLLEMVPEGQTLDKWDEFVACRIIFADSRPVLADYIKGWENMLKGGDPLVSVHEEKLEDGTYFVSYTSASRNEYGMYRFFSAADGVYSIGYSVKLDKKSDSRTTIWRNILFDSSLTQNAGASESL